MRSTDRPYRAPRRNPLCRRRFPRLRAGPVIINEEIGIPMQTVLFKRSVQFRYLLRLQIESLRRLANSPLSPAFKLSGSARPRPIRNDMRIRGTRSSVRAPPSGRRRHHRKCSLPKPGRYENRSGEDFASYMTWTALGFSCSSTSRDTLPRAKSRVWLEAKRCLISRISSRCPTTGRQ